MKLLILAFFLCLAGHLSAGNSTVVFTGGTNFVNLDKHGYLESILTNNLPDKAKYFKNIKWPLIFRNIAWQSDTVYKQQRPRNFGTHEDFLKKLNAKVIISNFGQMEILDQEKSLADFIKAYEALLDQYEAQTKNIILVTPFPFTKNSNSLMPDLTRYNPKVKEYAEAIIKLAKKRSYGWVDLSQMKLQKDEANAGVHLNDKGYKKASVEIAAQLLVAPAQEISEELRQAVLAKNELWSRHWRPDNWGFLYGNRTHVPSSQDHINRKERWFPAEIKGILPMIEEKENEIVKLLKREK